MSWVELRVVVPRSRVERLSELAFSLGALGVEEGDLPGTTPRFKQPWDTEAPPVTPDCLFKAWFDTAEAEAARAALGEACDDAEVELVAVQEEDWAESWKVHHHRVVISDRLSVAPPWEAQPGDVVVPPGNAFGTGDHPTTLACLRAIDRLAGECKTCLDVGCGSGVLALAAARLGLRAEGLDIDPDSVSSAMENAELNGLDVRFSTAPLERYAGSWDLVVANLYAEVLCILAPDLVRLTGRHLVLAGILADRADSVVAALSPPLSVAARVTDGDWVSLHLVRA